MAEEREGRSWSGDAMAGRLPQPEQEVAPEGDGAFCLDMQRIGPRCAANWSMETTRPPDPCSGAQARVPSFTWERGSINVHAMRTDFIFRSISLPLVSFAIAAGYLGCSSDDPPSDAPTTGSSSVSSSSGGGSDTSSSASGGGIGGNGGSGGSGGEGGGTGGNPMVCVPGTTMPCYTGAAGTEGKGVCKPGQATCVPDGSGYGSCEGEVTPAAEEACDTGVDDDCDGTVNEPDAGCICEPGTTASCYSGPPNTMGVGVCVAGAKTCAADGKSYGACVGEVIPQSETCATPGDDDCNGKTNEGGVGCSCVPNEVVPCYGGPPGTKDVGPCKGGMQTCNAQGTGFGPCAGEVVPQPEMCGTPIDDNCNGQVNEGGSDCVCQPNAVVSCYSGPAGTVNVGVCKAGMAQCDSQGLTLGPCNGQVTPQPETCATAEDDNCNGQANEGGAGCVCLPSSVAACYTGPAGTQNVGICKPGTKMCDALGTSYGPCNNEVVPQIETCNTPGDDDCDGQVNESGPGCVCLPNSNAVCYSGPAGTQGVGACKAGVKTCNSAGTAYGACAGEVVPAASELCNTNVDDNCNGQLNEGCSVSYAVNVQPILGTKCAPCHTGGGSGGANLGNDYASTQLLSYYCPGLTKGACTIMRIQNGSMPPGACTGNPALDAGNPQCLTAAEQSILQAWISGGQLP